MRERKYKKSVKARQIFLVLCEGETEKAYVDHLKRQYRLPIVVKTKVSGGGINERLVRQYVSELGLASAADCRVFFVYDCDVKAVTDRLLKMKGTAILSNPCIELWFLLHASEHCSPIKAEEVVRKLRTSHQVWSQYRKGIISSPQTGFLNDGLKTALARAGKLAWPENPSSNMGIFIEALEAALNC